MTSTKASATIAFLLSSLCAAEVHAHPGSGIVVDREGQVYFVVPGQHYIMKIDRDGRLTTFVSDPRLSLPHHLVIDRDGNIYTCSDDDGIVWKISPDGQMTEHFDSRELRDAGLGNVGQWGDPFTIDSAGNIYFTSEPRGRTQIYRIDLAGDGSLLAGSDEGYADGTGGDARFGNLHFASMSLGSDGILYVTDRTRIRAVAPDGTVSTLAFAGDVNMEFAAGIAFGPESAIYVVDYRGSRLIHVTSDGVATPTPTPLAGRGKLFAPAGVAIGPDGDIYVLDAEAFGVRVVKVSSEGRVTHLAAIDVQWQQIVMIFVLMLALPLLLVLWLRQRKSTGRVDAILRVALVGIIVVLTWIAGGALPPSFYLRHVGLLRHVVLMLYAVTAVRYVQQATKQIT